MLYYRREKEEYVRDLFPFRSGVGDGKLRREAVCRRNKISAFSTPCALRRQENAGKKGRQRGFCVDCKGEG